MSTNVVASRLTNHTFSLTWDFDPGLNLSSDPRLKPTDAERVSTPKSEVEVHGLTAYAISPNAAVCA